MFRHLRDEHNHTLSHNFRPIQPLGDRHIWYNLDINEIDKEVDLGREIPYDTVDNNLDDGAADGAAMRLQHSCLVVLVILSVMFLTQ